MANRWSIAALLWLLPAGAGAAPLPLPLPLVGDFLEDGYVSTLRATWSHEAAMQSDLAAAVPELIRVHAEPDGLHLLIGIDWHEGYDLFVITADGRIARDPGAGDPRPAALIVVDPRHLRLTAPGAAVPRDYTFVGRDTSFVAAVALGGPWVDAFGGRYRFDPDGTATFPDRTFHFTPVLDPFYDNHDYIDLAETGGSYAYRRTAATLTLTPGRPEPYSGWAPDFARPMLVLHAAP